MKALPVDNGRTLVLHGAPHIERAVGAIKAWLARRAAAARIRARPDAAGKRAGSKGIPKQYSINASRVHGQFSILRGAILNLTTATAVHDSTVIKA